jgi:hypothetical protein
MKFFFCLLIFISYLKAEDDCKNMLSKAVDLKVELGEFDAYLNTRPIIRQLPISINQENIEDHKVKMQEGFEFKRKTNQEINNIQRKIRRNCTKLTSQCHQDFKDILEFEKTASYHGWNLSFLSKHLKKINQNIHKIQNIEIINNAHFELKKANHNAMEFYKNHKSFSEFLKQCL